MELFGILLLALSLGYVIPIVYFSVGFRRVIGQNAPSAAGKAPLVTVVVAARNEEAFIERCIASILENDYPEDRMEVIVVDDQSTDRTSDIVRRLQTRYNRVAIPAGDAAADEEQERLRLLSMPENDGRVKAHKKFAIAKGVEAARGEIILTTDADCRVSNRWVETMATQFSPDVGFVAGAVLYEEGSTFFSRIQALEFLGFMAIGAGTIGVGRPHLCNGANLAYRRGAFIELGGYEGLDHVTSGDDELLMHKFAYTSPWSVRSCMDRQAAVTTLPNPTVRDFFEQRRRWASLDLHYTEMSLVVVSVLFYLFYVALLGSILALAFAPGFWPAVLAAMAVKMTSEMALLWPASRHFGRQSLLMRYFIPAQILQVPYIVAVGAAGIKGGYSWKDRQIGR